MSDSSNPFVLLARITVKQGRLNEYLSIAADVDHAVETTEEGMLLHHLNLDPEDPHKLVWTEVYRRSDDFLIHADNPPVLDYVEKHQQLASDFTLEIYGNVTQAVIDKIHELNIPLKHFRSSEIGYFQAERFA